MKQKFVLKLKKKNTLRQTLREAKIEDGRYSFRRKKVGAGRSHCERPHLPACSADEIKVIRTSRVIVKEEGNSQKDFEEHMFILT